MIDFSKKYRTTFDDGSFCTRVTFSQVWDTDQIWHTSGKTEDFVDVEVRDLGQGIVYRVVYHTKVSGRCNDKDYSIIVIPKDSCDTDFYFQLSTVHPFCIEDFIEMISRVQKIEQVLL